MLSANKEKLHSFFTGSNQFIIPFFQRAYVWKIDNWAEFWDSIFEELAELKAKKESEHFIGTIIIKQAETEKLGSLIYDLIDGQQRLTTICLLLRALHDSTDDDNFKKWIYNLLAFTDSYGKQHIRIIHSKVDSTYFQDVILSENNNIDLKPANNKIVDAYFYFKGKIQNDIQQTDIRDVAIIILERLPVIHMALSKGDDVQQIFDTINSLGVKLTTGELLKNYLFSFKTLEPKYEEYWQSVFETDEESVLFWDKDKTAGRIVRSTIELFLYSYLVIIKENVIKLESLFKEFKLYLKDKKSNDLLIFAKELKEYALLYEQLPDGEQLAEISFSDHEKRFFHIMNGLDITTVFPLVLFIYKNVKDVNDRETILRCLESYLVRRTICKLTTKNYNNLFISILIELKKLPTFTPDDFKNKLLGYTEDTNRFPDDNELKIAFATSQIVNQYSKEILYCIALYHLSHAYQDKSTLNNTGFSVEHIMPKKWRNKWILPVGTTELTRDTALLTLGNLTLVKGKLNSSMRDSAWDDKKTALTQFSTLRITTDYLNNIIWDESVITKRTEDLYNTSILIWKR
jgi:uncharacterized protein with ParB-like and HNH nuclease domain